MSLINDALKRVKEAQHQPPPSASVGPQFLPVEPVPATRHQLGLLLPLGLAGVALLTLLLVWELARKDNSAEAVAVRAQTAVQEEPSAASFTSQTLARSSEATPPASASSRETSAASKPKIPAAVATQITSASPTNSASNTALSNSPAAPQQTTRSANPTASDAGAVLHADASGQSGATNPPAVAEVQPPQPAPLRLQGIVFSAHPSAVINGKTLFVGDRIREFRVVAISQDTATLAAGGRTNVLSLSE